MRVVALITVVWSFVGMPMLCEAGVLVECCMPADPSNTKAVGNADERPGKCPCHEPCERSDGPEEPQSRDCGSCADACNAISPHSKQTSDGDVAVMRAAMMAVTQAPTEADPSLPHHSRDVSKQQLAQHLPFPVSDRPLQI